MKKKKIAVYANGWSNEIICNTINGIMRSAQENDTDVFLFLSHAAWGATPEINMGEDNIFHLGIIDDYDGLIIMSNILNTPEHAIKKLCDKAIKAGIPTVSIGMNMEGTCYIEPDNITGMRELATHLIEEHNVKKIVFAGGTDTHPDCLTRLNILLDVAKQHQIVIEDEDIYFGDWSYLWAQNLAIQICNSSKGLPDAVICANDDTALAFISMLHQNGYSVPKDIIVTGFDCTLAGQSVYPTLTTVLQNYESMGYAACNWVYDMLDGKENRLKINIPSQFVQGESSCTEKEGVNGFNRIGTDAYNQSMINIMFQQAEGEIEGQIFRATDFTSLKGALEWQYLHHHVFEGDSFYMVLENDYINSIYQKKLQMKTVRWEEDMSVIVALSKGKLLPITTVNHHELIPGYQKEQKSHLYCFAPLHLNQNSYGYVVFVDNTKLILERRVCNYVGRIQQALDRFRNNLYVELINRELMEISQTDFLTSLGNRFCYSKKAIPLYEQNKAEGIRTVVMFVDINYMKHINDGYGHLQGDLALRVVADVIKKSIPENWIAIRYGGDEFLMVGALGESDSPDQIQEDIRIGVEQAKIDMSLPFELSISCGNVIAETNNNMTLADYIEEADARMYLMKEEMHRRYKAAHQEET